jgi:hypothetical protein
MPSFDFTPVGGADGRGIYGSGGAESDPDSYRRRRTDPRDRLAAIRNARNGDIFGAAVAPTQRRFEEAKDRLGAIRQAFGGDVQGAIPGLVGRDKYKAATELYKGIGSLFGGGSAAGTAAGTAAGAAEAGSAVGAAAQAGAAAEAEGFATWLYALLA